MTSSPDAAKPSFPASAIAPATGIPSVALPVLSILVEALGGALQSRGLMIVPTHPSDKMVQTAALLSGVPEATVRQIYGLMIATCCGETSGPNPAAAPTHESVSQPAQTSGFPAASKPPLSHDPLRAYGAAQASPPVLNDAVSDAMSILREARRMQTWKIEDD